MFDAIRGRTTQKPQEEIRQEPRFAHPPLWIHESLAAKCFLGKESPLLISRRREAKRRMLLQMLDRIPVRSERSAQIAKPARVPADVPAVNVPTARIVPGTRLQK